MAIPMGWCDRSLFNHGTMMVVNNASLLLLLLLFYSLAVCSPVNLVFSIVRVWDTSSLPSQSYKTTFCPLPSIALHLLLVFPLWPSREKVQILLPSSPSASPSPPPPPWLSNFCLCFFIISFFFWVCLQNIFHYEINNFITNKYIYIILKYLNKICFKEK